MDSFDFLEEINRTHKCADELYQISGILSNNCITREDLVKWREEAKAIINRYNVTMLLPILFEATSAIAGNNMSDQANIAIKEFYERSKQALEARKFNLGRLQIDKNNKLSKYECRLGSIRIRIEFAACDNGENKIFFNGLLVLYNDKVGMKTKNSQWNSLLTGFIFENGEFCLTTLQIENLGHTAAGGAMTECVSKLQRLLKANYVYYKKEGKNFPKVLIKKVKSEDLWQLKISN